MELAVRDNNASSGHAEGVESCWNEREGNFLPPPDHDGHVGDDIPPTPLFNFDPDDFESQGWIQSNPLYYFM